MKKHNRIMNGIVIAVLACMLSTAFFSVNTEAATVKSSDDKVESEVKAVGNTDIPNVTIKLYNKNGSEYTSDNSYGGNTQTVLYQPSAGSFNANDMIVGVSAILNNNTGISGSLRYQIHCHTTGWTPIYSSGQKVVGDFNNGLSEPSPWIEAVTFFFAGELSNYYYLDYNAYTTPVDAKSIYPGMSSLSFVNWEMGKPYWYQWIGIKDDTDIIGAGIVPNGYSKGSGYNFAGTWGMWLPISGIQVEVKPYNLTLNVNPNGGAYKNSTGVTTSIVNSNTEYTIEEPVRDGYVFDGWSISQTPLGVSSLNGNQLPDNNREGSISGNRLTTGNMNVTLTANWKAINYKVHFDGNGATSGNTPDMSYAFDQGGALNTNGFKKQYSINYNGNGGISEKEADIAEAQFNGWQDNNVFYYRGMYFNSYGIDAPYYVNKYPDVKNWCGYNKYAVIHHWYTYIISQGVEDRQSAQNFKIGDYMKYGGGDLAATYGNNRLAYVAHWMNNGVYEGRTGAVNIDTETSDLYPDRAWVANLATRQNETVVLTADWTPGSVVLPKAERAGYQFIGWYTSPDGGEFIGKEGATYTPEVSGTTLYAHWVANDYEIAFDGNGATSGSMENQKAKYDEVITLQPNQFERIGYTFTGWNTNPDGTGTALEDRQQVRNLTTEENGTVILYAQWRANSYTIHFDGNGATDGAMEDIPAVYDQDITLPTNQFIRTTEQGESVFTGWNLENGIYDVEFADQQTVRNLSAEDGAVVTLYAIWDDCPKIEAVDRYFSLSYAQQGKITEEELLSTASATDREDGELENRTSAQIAESGINGSLSLYGYATTDFTELTDSASVSMTYKAVDSIGNTVYKTVTVYITSTEPIAQTDFVYTRFINEKYYKAAYENGGLHLKSVWRIDPAYESTLQNALANLKNETPEKTYHIKKK